MDSISLVLTIFAIIGAIFNAYGNGISFCIWIVTNISFACVTVWNGYYEQTPLWIVYACISVIGIINWRKRINRSEQNDNNGVGK